jgi:hypothetical protein
MGGTLSRIPALAGTATAASIIPTKTKIFFTTGSSSSLQWLFNAAI